MEFKAPSAEEIIAALEDATEKEKALVRSAYDFSEKVHAGHKRYSGEPFFNHPATVALYLSEMGMDAVTVCAGLLHDSIEDVGVTKEQVTEQFGKDVYTLVDGVTKLGKVRYHGSDRHTESLRKLFAATAQDVRVILIKLADRLHNARTLQYVPKEKQKRIAKETLEVYAPVADRLGMSIMKKDLEDAAFPYAYPDEYKKVYDLFHERYADAKDQLDKMEKSVARILVESGIRNFRMHSRIKGIYSLHKKLERKKWDMTQIHDITALRVLVSDIASCYQVLGIIHGNWRPIPGKMKDYIASPKPNGYQSIHTTVHTGENATIEIQIRTEEMHKASEYGLAAHLSYKEVTTKSGKKGTSVSWMQQFFPRGVHEPSEYESSLEKKTYSSLAIPGWIRAIAESHTTVGDEKHATNDEYIEDLKNDFFSHRIFLFTPKGDVVDLPIHATPIDFAYAIHSELGDHIAGAKVNGKLVSIEDSLHNGDIVEILTKQEAKPTKKWLDVVKSSMARKFIRLAVYGKSEDTPPRPRTIKRRRMQQRSGHSK
jgi:GTP pyrophosphokinase